MQLDTEIDRAWDLLRSGDVIGGRQLLKEFTDRTEGTIEELISALAMLAFDAMRHPYDGGLFIRTRDHLISRASSGSEAASFYILSWETMPSNDLRRKDLERLAKSDKPVDAHGAHLLGLTEMMVFDQKILTDYSADSCAGITSELSVGTACLLHGNAEESLSWFERAISDPDRTTKLYRPRHSRNVRKRPISN